MQTVLQRGAVIMTALFSMILVSGCEKASKQNSEPAAVSTAAPPAEKEDIQPEADEEPAVELSKTAPHELLIIAEEALDENRVDRTLEAIRELRGREKMSVVMKMHVARVLFGAGAMKESAAVYDEVLEQSPGIKPQLWQRGLALYYAEEFKKGVDQFDTHQFYNSQDVENSVWHLLCKARLTSVDKARESMIQIEDDSRIPMKEVFEMFAGKGSPEQVIAATGFDEQNIVRNGSIYHGWLYVGLFHEMMGDQKAANEAMKTALKCKPIIPGLMGHVAEGHLRVRGAYSEVAE